MEVHSVGNRVIEDQMRQLMEKSVPKKAAQPFVDPIKEFARASHVESTVRNWLTYPIEERKRIVKESFMFVPRYKADPSRGTVEESEKDYEARQLERWRGLCVIIQEESRAKPPNRSVEVAVGALKQLFYDCDWKTKALPVPPTTE